MKSYSFAVVSALLAGALAQNSAESSSTSSAPAPASTFIPSNISQSCKDYLGKLDSSPDISKCLSALVTATAEFNPTSSGTYSDDALANTLKALCTTGCDETQIRTHLADFYSACQLDLLGDSANEQVRTTYDILYILEPLRGAVCSKDPDTSKYCVQEIHVDDSSSSTNVGKALVATPGQSNGAEGLHVSHDTLNLLEKKLYEEIKFDNGDLHFGITPRAEENNTLALMPDTNTWRLTSLIYLFISPEYSSAQLCTKCAQQVIASYARFESATPYAMGLTHSPLLGGQLDLWTNMTQKCGSDFTQTIMNDANVRSDTNQPTTGGFGAASRTGVIASAVVTVVTGLAGLLVL